MSDDDDVPTTVDFRNAEHVAAWLATAEDRPGRVEIRRRIAEYVAELGRARVVDAANLGLVEATKLNVLELGGGPGFLAEQILAAVDVDRYVLFDFAPPMLAVARQRLGERVTYCLGDFVSPDWAAKLQGPFDVVVSMQAVHELRHKRRARLLYEQVRSLLRRESVLLVCDHEPKDDARSRALHASASEQIDAMTAAGFTHAAVVAQLEQMYLIACKAP